MGDDAFIYDDLGTPDHCVKPYMLNSLEVSPQKANARNLLLLCEGTRHMKLLRSKIRICRRVPGKHTIALSRRRSAYMGGVSEIEQDGLC